MHSHHSSNFCSPSSLSSSALLPSLFTPPSSPSLSTRNMATKLSFSEADSINSSSRSSSQFIADRSGVRKSGVTEFFDTSLDCERKAKLTREQMIFENKFANSFEQVGGVLPHSSNSVNWS